LAEIDLSRLILTRGYYILRLSFTEESGIFQKDCFMRKLPFLLTLCLGFQGLLFASDSPTIDPNERAALIHKITTIIKDANDINAPDKEGRPPLILATLINDKKLVELLVSGDANIQAADADGNTALHIAAAENYLSLVEYLLDKGAQINLQNNAGQTPLLFAICQKNAKMTEYLLGRQANPDIQSNCPYPPLHQAIINQDYPTIKLLLKYHANINALDNNGQAPLHLAIEQENPDSIALLLEQNANANLWSRDGYTPLDMAVSIGNKKIIKMLLDNGAEINRYNSEGQTALFIACWSLDSNPDVVSQLLEAGANPNIPTPQWIYPLRAAKNRQRKAVADILEKYGALEFGSQNPATPSFIPQEYITKLAHSDGVPNKEDGEIRNKIVQLTNEFIDSGQALQYKDEYGYTLLHWTLSRRDDSATRKLIEQGADVNAKSIIGTTPLMMALHNLVSTSIMQLLLEKGADVNAADLTGWTALHWAARNNSKIIPLLIQTGANINTRTIFSATPLWEAAYRGNKKAIELFLEAGADIEACDYNGTTPLMAACSGNDIALVQLLVEKGAKVNVTDLKGHTPLLIAFGRKDIPEYLINKGADINTAFDDGTPLLHQAVNDGNINLVKLLLQKGVHVNILTHRKQTALHWAAYAGNEQMVKLLLENKVDISLKDFKGKTACDYAVGKKHIAVVKLLDPEFAQTIVPPTRADVPLTQAEQRQKQRKARYDGFATDRAIWLAADSTPLHKAAIANDLDQVKKLLAGKTDPNVFCRIQYANVTPLHCAVRFDHEEIVRYLISQGVNPNQFDPKEKMTALHYAISNKHVEMVEMLLNNGVDLKLQVYKDNPLLPLAASTGTVEIIKILNLKGADVGSKGAVLCSAIYNPGTLESLILSGTNVNAKDDSGRTALFRAVSAEQIESIKVLLKYGADINAQAGNGETPLCNAITAKSASLLTFLIEQKADVNIPDERGQTPIYLALRSVELTKIMLNAGADLNIVDKEGESPVHELSEDIPEKERFIDLINLFMQNNVKLDTPDKRGRTLLLRMIPNAPLDEDTLQNRLELIGLLIEKGVNINHQDNDKETPLFYTLKTSNVEFLRAILDANPDMEITNKHGYTPLLDAILNKQTEHCRLLIEKGANVNAKTSSGLTCLKLAEKNPEIITLLKKHGATE
jgi:ankyrin repeat protein